MAKSDAAQQSVTEKTTAASAPITAASSSTEPALPPPPPLLSASIGTDNFLTPPPFLSASLPPSADLILNVKPASVEPAQKLSDEEVKQEMENLEQLSKDISKDIRYYRQLAGSKEARHSC